MALTLDEVRTELARDEPDYRAASRLGPGVGGHLLTLVREDDPQLAGRAAYLAGLVGDSECLTAVAEAARSRHDVVRVAAAAVVPRLAPPQAEELMAELLVDADPGVRKVAVRAGALRPTAALLPALLRMQEDDPEPALRALAGSLARDAQGTGSSS